MASTRSFPPRGERRSPPAAEDVRIDGYQVQRLVGVGRLTAVYAGILESHQQPVAIKVLLPHLAASEAFAQRFLQAANAARLVNHEHVLPCWDVGTSGGLVYTASELCRGATLAEHLRRGPLSPERSVWIAWQCARGLEAIHQAGLVHGDLRPENILLDPEDGVRLADGGLPRVPAEPADARGSASFRPASDAPPHEADDAYAIGAVLVAMIAGPARLQAGNVPADALPAGTDPNIAAVVAKATAAAPEDRYGHAWQLREDLERAQHGFAPIHALGSTSGPVARLLDAVHPPAASTGPVPLRHRRWAWIAAGAALLAVAAGAALLLRPAAAPEPAPPAAPAIIPAAEAARPPWAAAAGHDAAGTWAEIAVGGERCRLRRLEPGSFWIGSPADDPAHLADEEGRLITFTRPCWLGETEVTQRLWRTACGSPPPCRFAGDDLPVESVSWEDCQAFLSAVNRACGAPARLPTEAEWEYACRAGGQGAPADAGHAWTADAGDGPPHQTRAVGGLQANAWGFHDLQGNVMEWCEDTYGRYPREAASDPLATGGIYRVIRGGAWNMAAAQARAAARGKALPTTRQFHVGLRLAVSG